MVFYEEQNNFSEEKSAGTVYHTGNGFYNPYVEPLWKREKRLIRGSGNGIGMAALGYVAFSLLAGIIYAVLVQLVFPAANIHGLLYVTESVEWILNLLIYVFSLMIPFGIYALCIKMPLKVAVPFRKAKADLTFGGFLVGLGTGILASYATTYLQLGLEMVGIGITMPEYETPKTAFGIILYVINLTVAPAFIEEIIFRGIVMQSLRRFGDIFALVSSALIFGIFHLNLIQMPYAFILGLCIGYFVMRTGSLWVGVLIHFVNNSVAVAFELLYPHMTEEVYYMANAVYNLVCVILSVIAIGFLLAKYKDIFRFEPSKSVLAPGKKTVYFLTSPALILAMLAAVIMTMPYIHLI
ncbi:MAG: CPBP family intramembrane metalloprotease [Ruminococcaceae bacterium]|nr:CPBP family intramembrane metalloprotease [Oscillospiraceae bacterium]